MSVDVTRVREYVGASASDDEFIQRCINEAMALVTAYVNEVNVPVAVMDNAVTQVASELYNRRNAPSGIAQFASFDGTPQRVANDPLTSVYRLLNRYVTMGV